MSELSRYCPGCYRRNAWDAVRCVACTAVLATEESYDERLIWALRHPDSGVATLAAELLARRRVRGAIPALIRLVDAADPYRAAAAAAALRAFADDTRVASLLEGLQRHPSTLVRHAVAGQPGSGPVDDRASRRQREP